MPIFSILSDEVDFNSDSKVVSIVRVIERLLEIGNLKLGFRGLPRRSVPRNDSILQITNYELIITSY